ncbi:apoptosis-associated speck-like protein containing a CARD isoform X2 [Grus americana]|uniref:apoptosis-associated speck-like protein containing a CARD isoform X2 n=1 Tax=Grus americana TaxID=9117 RepID=UPI0024084653|nr:apoptosis-associated speck-like protein containing a CARD isoform X2 [Grus americana]
MAGCRDRILRALEELSESELRRLKATLNRLPVAAGYDTIPRGRMEGGDAIDLTDLVIGHYREGYGARVTAEALRRIQRRDLADGLVGGDGDAPRSSRALDDLGDDLGDDLSDDLGALPPAERFVARHRLALIQRVRAVPTILDRLEAAGVLTAEQVAVVVAGPTLQDQMRRLLATAPAWGRRGHRLFLQAMRCLHPYLMEDLEAGEGSLDRSPQNALGSVDL